MNKNGILAVIAVLIVVLVLLLSWGGKKSATVESQSDETQIAAEATEKVLEETKKTTETPETVTEESLAPADTGESNAGQSTAPAAKPNTSKETTSKDSPVDREKTIEERIKDNAHLGVVQGAGSGGDINLDDNTLPTYEQKPNQTVPTEKPKPNEPVALTVPLTEITFEMYNAMSAAEQKAVVDAFGSMEDFMVWFNYVKAQYEAAHPDIEVGADGVVDLS